MTIDNEPQGTPITNDPETAISDTNEIPLETKKEDPNLSIEATTDELPEDESNLISGSTPGQSAVPDSTELAESFSTEGDSTSSSATANPLDPDNSEPSAAEREYRAALEAARALGLDKAPEPAAVDIEEQEAARLVSELGLDLPAPEEPTPIPTLEESESVEEVEITTDEEDTFLGPEPTDGRAWYVLITYSGHENRV
jgi:hypothetical protein